MTNILFNNKIIDIMFENNIIKFFKLLICSVFVMSLLFSCNNSSNVQSNFNKDSNFSYLVNQNNITVSWSGYKTNDKIKVSGSFNEINCNREGKFFSSVEKLLNGLEFSINSSSSLSGDPMRDLNLKDHFFNIFSDNYTIHGLLSEPINDSININFNIFGINRTIRMPFFVSSVYKLNDNSYLDIEIKGSINLVSFGAENAFNSIHKKCYDLHKGIDGISKTWEDVDIHVIAKIKRV